MSATLAEGRTGAKRRFDPTILIFVSPTLILLFVFVAYPFLRAIWLSLTKTTLLGGTVGFVGLDNFIELFQDPQFGTFVANSVFWTVGGVGLQLVFGVIGALLLNQRFKLRGVVRGLAMIPWATPSVLVALIWLWLLDPNRGLINTVLERMGLMADPVAWLSDPHTALPTLIAIDAWQGIPFFAVMVLAALQAVPEELKESARTDGCGVLGVFRHVVVPSILPTVLITLVLRLIWTANYIDLAYVLTGGGPGIASTTIPLQSYLTAYKQGQMGNGAAYAVIQAVILAILVVIYLRLTQTKGAKR
ncbi:sugar ABC transporter permease [Microbacterium sp. KR10-403]|uniref:carbohydrate ABC transporter permease n=1 Tax=Microbacterium sp. KR10-403 TaxID=3158581 RepID=UPI0032E5137A